MAQMVALCPDGADVGLVVVHGAMVADARPTPAQQALRIAQSGHCPHAGDVPQRSRGSPVV